jgi:hypothetical protein
MKKKILGGTALLAIAAVAVFNVNLAFIAIICGSCQNSVGNVLENTIPIDVKMSHAIDINQGKIIKLETTDRSLLYEIIHIEFFKEKMIILTREQVCVFDKNGKFLLNISAKGEAPHEYLNLGNFFVKNDNIYLLDHITKKIVCFDEHGNFISSTKINTDTHFPISEIYPLENGYFIGKNMYQGSRHVVPALSLLDEHYKFIKTIEGKNILFGITMNDVFFQYGDQILYWEMLNDTIFSIVSDSIVVPKYFIDFGNQALPKYDVNDEGIYDLINFTNAPENIDKFAGFIGHIYEDDHFLKFRFQFRKKTHCVYYNKFKKTSNIYRFEDEKQVFSTTPFVCFNNGQLYLAVISETNLEENPYLVIFDESYFIDN